MEFYNFEQVSLLVIGEEIKNTTMKTSKIDLAMAILLAFLSRFSRLKRY